MLIALHHGDQQCFGQLLLSVVRLPPMEIEVTQTTTLELAVFTVERLYLVVDLTDVFLQISIFLERFITLGTFDWFTTIVIDSNMFHQSIL